jgi:hypothetical protein
MGIMVCVFVMRAARFSKLVVMSNCLNESMGCSGMGLDGRFTSDVASILCHLVAIGDALRSWAEELCERFTRCSGDSACRNLRK